MLVSIGWLFGDDKPPAAQDSADTPAPTLTPWAEAPTDGTWGEGRSAAEVGFGEESELSTAVKCTFQILEPPMLMTDDDGATVTMTSTVVVRNFGDADEKCFPPGPYSAAFKPGFFDMSRHDERYGGVSDLSCESETFPLEAPVTCTLSYTAPADEIPNSYWRIWHGMGAWPSQTR